MNWDLLQLNNHHYDALIWVHMSPIWVLFYEHINAAFNLLLLFSSCHLLQKKALGLFLKVAAKALLHLPCRIVGGPERWMLMLMLMKMLMRMMTMNDARWTKSAATELSHYQSVLKWVRREVENKYANQNRFHVFTYFSNWHHQIRCSLQSCIMNHLGSHISYWSDKSDVTLH